MGIYAPWEEANKNIIKHNIIRNVRDCGIYTGPDAGLVKDNEVLSYEDTIGHSNSGDRRLAEKLDERNIRSIYE